VITQTKAFNCQDISAAARDPRLRAPIFTSMLGHFFSVLFSAIVSEIVRIRRIQSVTRASQRTSTPETRQRPRRDTTIRARRTNSRNATRRFPRRRTPDITSKAHFFYSIFMVLRVQTRPSTASLERVRSPATTRRDTQPSWSGHTDLDHARDATEGIDSRTHDVFGACILHASVCVMVTSRPRLTLGVVE